MLWMGRWGRLLGWWRGCWGRWGFYLGGLDEEGSAVALRAIPHPIAVRLRKDGPPEFVVGWRDEGLLCCGIWGLRVVWGYRGEYRAVFRGR